MSDWCGGLVWILVLGPTNLDERVPPDATRLFAEARRTEAIWEEFPGFTAELEIECQGRTSRGRVIVERDGRVFVEQVPNRQRDWALEKLDTLVRARLPREDVGKAPWVFVPGQAGGLCSARAVCRRDDPLGACHWIRDQQVQASDLRSARTRQRTTTLKTERNPDGKHLPTVLVLHLWDARTQELQATETTLLSWRRVGTIDLPATIEVLSAGPAAAQKPPAVARLALTGHRIFSPEIVAGR